jgi:hypothetical protein
MGNWTVLVQPHICGGVVRPVVAYVRVVVQHLRVVPVVAEAELVRARALRGELEAMLRDGPRVVHHVAPVVLDVGLAVPGVRQVT